MKILIKETSKSGTIANINGVIGQIKGIDFKTFEPYNESQLATKTAYKENCGWMEFESIEQYNEAYKLAKTARKERNLIFEQNQKEKEIKEDAIFAEMLNKTNEPTVENLEIILKCLNRKNWGTWKLPKLTISYSANQYNCDGQTATTIHLKKPINFNGEMVSMFEYGAPRMHLNKYTKSSR